MAFSLLLVAALSVLVCVGCAPDDVGCPGSTRRVDLFSAHGSSFEMPINTNFPKVGCGEADARVGETRFGVYDAMDTDPFAPTEAQVVAALRELERASSREVRLVNLPAALVENATAVQVLSNLAVGKSTFTWVFPAGWNRAARLPILLSAHSGALSNNEGVFGTNVPNLALIAAASGGLAQPAITILGNAGGKQSQGLHLDALAAVGDVLDLAARDFGGDKHRVVTSGFSRGANTAVLWASNPLGRDYTVIGVFASAGPYAFGRVLSVPFTNHPGLAADLSGLFGDKQAAFYSHAPGPPEVQARFLELFAGATTAAEADAVSALAFVARLASSRPVIALGIPTHDGKIPLDSALALDRALTVAGVPHRTALQVRGGHGSVDDTSQALNAFLEALLTGRGDRRPDGRFYFLGEKAGQPPSTSPLADPSLVFTACFPRAMEPGSPGELILCGTPGMTYAALARDAVVAQVDATGTFDDTGCRVVAFAAPAAQTTLDWAFTAGGAPVPAAAVTAVDAQGADLPLQTRVVAGLRPLAEFYSSPNTPNVSFGAAWVL